MRAVIPFTDFTDARCSVRLGARVLTCRNRRSDRARSLTVTAQKAFPSGDRQRVPMGVSPDAHVGPAEDARTHPTASVFNGPVYANVRSFALPCTFFRYPRHCYLGECRRVETVQPDWQASRTAS